MTFLAEGPAETTGFMILGFAVIYGALLLHLASIASRFRNLRRDLELLKDVKK